MASWHSKQLGSVEEAYTRIIPQIRESFLALALAQARADHYAFDAAVFSQHDSETDIVTVYFTPSVARLALEFGAVPCEKPVPTEDFGLEIGDERTWAHFPNHHARSHRL